MTVLSDNYLAGKQSGEAVVAYLTEKYGEAKGTVLEITGNLGQNVAQLRGGGFNDVMKANPNINVITKIGDWDSAKGVDIVRDVAQPRISTPSTCTRTASTPQAPSRCSRSSASSSRAARMATSSWPAWTPASTRSTRIRDGNSDQASNQPIPDFGVVAADYIEKALNGETIEPGEVVKEGALWSPARIEDSDVGPQLFLATTSVGPDNVDDERLWGNIEEAMAAASPAPTAAS